MYTYQLYYYYYFTFRLINIKRINTQNMVMVNDNKNAISKENHFVEFIISILSYIMVVLSLLQYFHFFFSCFQLTNF